MIEIYIMTQQASCRLHFPFSRFASFFSFLISGQTGCIFQVFQISIIKVPIARFCYKQQDNDIIFIILTSGVFFLFVYTWGNSRDQ